MRRLAAGQEGEADFLMDGIPYRITTRDDIKALEKWRSLRGIDVRVDLTKKEKALKALRQSGRAAGKGGEYTESMLT